MFTQEYTIYNYDLRIGCTLHTLMRSRNCTKSFLSYRDDGVMSQFDLTLELVNGVQVILSAIV